MPLPFTGTGGPRVVTADALPASAAGQQMLSEQLLKTTRRAANTLLTVGILQLVFAGITFAIVSSAKGANVDHNALMIIVATLLTIGAVFLGLSFWARRSPLPASIIGLVLYGTMVAVNVVTTLSQAANREPGSGGGIGGLGIGYLDILIMIFLARGIKAALDHRKLERGEVTSV